MIRIKVDWFVLAINSKFQWLKTRVSFWPMLGIFSLSAGGFASCFPYSRTQAEGASPPLHIAHVRGQWLLKLSLGSHQFTSHWPKQVTSLHVPPGGQGRYVLRRTGSTWWTAQVATIASWSHGQTHSAYHRVSVAGKLVARCLRWWTQFPHLK